MNASFLSCDWGTTTFRLRLVESESKLHVINELTSDRGVRSFDGAGPARFESYLLQVMEAMDAPMVPVLISGMASSSVGWKELPYANVPFTATDAAALECESFHIRYRGADVPIHLFSGVRTPFDVMRGEESELIGILTLPETRKLAIEGCLVILPGTHCKHVRIENGRMVDFTTFLTGELFELLACQSILRATLDWDSLDEINAVHDDALAEGVCAARDRGMAAGLFKVRTRGVLDGASGASNIHYLLGLLIGDELQSLPRHDTVAPISIVLAAKYVHSYKRALEVLGFPDSRLMVLTAEQLEHATVRTHALWLQQHYPAGGSSSS